MLANQFESQHETLAVALSLKNSLKTLHQIALRTNFVADNKVAIHFDPSPTGVAAQKLDLGIGKSGRLSVVTHNLLHTGRLTLRCFPK